MADFHVACVKVGRVLGISEEEVSDILWENQKNINRRTTLSGAILFKVRMTERSNRSLSFATNETPLTATIAFSEEEVSDILWENQKNINRRTLDEDVVALCVTV